MKILYGVNGEGMGHVMRSAEVIRELSKKHEVEIIAGGKAANYLGKFGSVKRINYLSFVTREGKIKYFQTFLFNLVMLPFFIYSFLFILLKCIVKRPDRIVSDFEPISSYVGFLLFIPTISFDNQHIVTDTQIHKVGTSFSRFFYNLTVYFMTLFPRKKIITSFFYPKVLSKNSVLVALSLGGDNVLKNLEKLKLNCIVYGKTKIKSGKNLQVKKFDEKEFAKDLASSKGVICNAGMTTLSEAIYLKKPVLCIPLEGQFEQELNAYYIEREGYGLTVKEINKSVLKKFIDNNKFYKRNLARVEFSNEFVIKEIVREIN